MRLVKLFIFIILCSCSSIFGVKTTNIPAQLKKIVSEQALEISSFRALVDGKITYKNQTTRMRLVSICDQSQRYRFELLAQGTSIPIAFIVGQNSSFTYYNTFDREKITKPNSEDLFKKLLGIKIAAEDLCTAIAGKFQKHDIDLLDLVVSDFLDQTELMHKERRTIYKIGMLGLLIERISFNNRNLKVNLHYPLIYDSSNSRLWPNRINIFGNNLIGEFLVKSGQVEKFNEKLFEIY